MKRRAIYRIFFTIFALSLAACKPQNNSNGAGLLVGDNGQPGAQGPQGAQGAGGSQGPQGSMGPQGPMGPMGPQGPQGPQGPVGPVGSGGPMGPRGLQGPAGPQGPQGPQGAQGPAGVTSFNTLVGNGTCSRTRYVNPPLVAGQYYNGGAYSYSGQPYNWYLMRVSCPAGKQIISGGGACIGGFIERSMQIGTDQWDLGCFYNGGQDMSVLRAQSSIDIFCCS